MKSLRGLRLKYFLREKLWAIFGYEFFLKRRFRKNHGYPLNLENPRTFSEKIQWMKVYGQLERFSKYVDKYSVREYVKDRIGAEYLIPLIGVYEKVETIDFVKLPTSFVIKAAHGAGWIILVEDKNKLDWGKAKRMMNTWLRLDYYKKYGEPNYKNLKRRIIIEKFIKDSSGDLKDYKFLCFQGEPKFVQAHGYRFTDPRRDIFDINWNKLTVTSAKFKNFDQPVPRPEKLDEMLEICRKLAKDFPFVRVDLYNTTQGQIYFGELTFTPANGMRPFKPKEIELLFGELIDLNKFVP